MMCPRVEAKGQTAVESSAFTSTRPSEVVGLKCCGRALQREILAQRSVLSNRLGRTGLERFSTGEAPENCHPATPDMNVNPSFTLINHENQDDKLKNRSHK